mgnify:CR=1 FL=1
MGASQPHLTIFIFETSKDSLFNTNNGGLMPEMLAVANLQNQIMPDGNNFLMKMLKSGPSS